MESIKPAPLTSGGCRPVVVTRQPSAGRRRYRPFEIAGGTALRVVAACFATGVSLPTMAQTAASTSAPATQQRKVTVSASTAPWDTRLNRKFDFGMHNGRPPVMVFDPLLRPGVKVRFAVTGSTTTVVGGGSIPAGGQLDFPTDGQPEFGRPRFPSRYFGKLHEVAYLNMAVGVFTDADGQIIGKPFPIGTATVRTVPDGAAALSLGINDDNFADNTGALVVTVTLPRPQVIVE